MPLPYPRNLMDPNANYYTYADYLTWDEGERVEILYGEPVMSPAPNRRHQDISRQLVRQIGNFLDGKPCKLYYAPFDVRLFEKDGDPPEDVDTVVQPDIAVICDESKLDDAGCKGAPDLIIEILSQSTRTHDKTRKYRLYQRAGVREYWIVDPVHKAVQSLLHPLNTSDNNATAAGRRSGDNPA